MLVGERGGRKTVARVRAYITTTMTDRWVAARTLLLSHRQAVLRHGLRIIAVLTVLGAGLGYLLWGSAWTRLEAVHVHVTDPQAPSTGVALADDSVAARQRQILQAASVTLGEPLVEVDTETVAAQVKALGRYSRVSVERDWPQTLSISVTPRTPVLAATGGKPGLWLVDADGLAYESVPSAPEGVTPATLAGEPASAAAAAATAVLAFPPQRRAQIQQVQVDAGGIVTVRFETIDVRWGPAGQDELKSVVALALLDQPGVRLIDVTVPGRPVTTG